MKQYIKNFFYPEPQIFNYELPKEIVIAKIDEVISQKITYFGEFDIKGSFVSSDNFEIHSIPMDLGVRYYSKLTGHVVESQNGTTVIKTKVKFNYVLYFLFIFSILVGIVFLFKSVQSGSIVGIITELVAIVAAPAVAIGISNFSKNLIYDRYRKYIHTILIKHKTN